MGATTLTAPQALLVAACGLLTVFIMLAALSEVMTLLSRALNAGSKATVSAAPPAAPAPAQAVPAGQTYAGQVALCGVDEKTAACLMAIVSQETGIPLEELIFHKIKAL